MDIDFFMFKFLYFKSVTNVAFSPLIDKAEGYKKSFTLREHSGSRNLQAQSAREPFFYIIIIT